MFKTKTLYYLLAILALSGCSTTEPWDEDYKEDSPQSLEYRVEAHKDMIDDETCVFPDGLYIEAPEWVCVEDRPTFALGMYSMHSASYQYARNMAYLYAVREVTRKTSEEIRSMAKAHASSNGGGVDEETIQGISFKVAKNVRVVRSIVSPNKDVYVFVKVGGVEDVLDGKERAAWKAYKAQQAHDELTEKYKEATWSDDTTGSEGQ